MQQFLFRIHNMQYLSALFIGLTIIARLDRAKSKTQDDPGSMFGDGALTKNSMPYFSNLDAITNQPWFNEGSSCDVGTGIVLKRIVWKLFNHVDRLQPTELDDEYSYQSWINYDDYQSMLKYLNDDKLSCASLLKLDNLLSNFISNADVRRPSQQNLFNFDLRFHENSHIGITQPLKYLIVVLIIVGITSWFLINYAGYSEWKSNLLALTLTGFIQFYMHQHWVTINDRQERLEECQNPSFITRAFALFNYDYSNCNKIGLGNHSSSQLFVTNIALVWVQYISELVVQPLMTFLANFADISENFLSSFSGWNRLLAPFLLAFIMMCFLYFSINVVRIFLVERDSRPLANSRQRGRRKPLPINSNKS